MFILLKRNIKPKNKKKKHSYEFLMRKKYLIEMRILKMFSIAEQIKTYNSFLFNYFF